MDVIASRLSGMDKARDDMKKCSPELNDFCTENVMLHIFGLYRLGNNRDICVEIDYDRKIVTGYSKSGEPLRLNNNPYVNNNLNYTTVVFYLNEFQVKEKEIAMKFIVEFKSELLEEEVVWLSDNDFLRISKQSSSKMETTFEFTEKAQKYRRDSYYYFYPSSGCGDMKGRLKVNSTINFIDDVSLDTIGFQLIIPIESIYNIIP